MGGVERIVSYTFPSDKYIDFTPGVSGTTYTMPEYGFIYAIAQATSQSGSWCSVDFPLYSMSIDHSRLYATFKCFLPVRKGDVASIIYGEATLLLVRFIYAKGLEPK